MPANKPDYWKEWRNKNPEYGVKQHLLRMQGTKSRSLYLIKAARRRAKDKDLEFTITLDDVLPQIEKGFCDLTGIPFDFKTLGKRKRNPYSPSIDRIDSEKGYTSENIRIVLVAVNDCLNQYGEQIILPILEAMVKGIRKNVKKKSASPVPTSHN